MIAATEHLTLDQPSTWVCRFAPLIGAGLVLDLACGGGRHSRWLAKRGFSVLAVDRDPSALAATAGERIQTLRFDLEVAEPAADPAFPLSPERFAGIVVTNYLHRPLFAALLASLAPGGLLIYETFAQGNAAFGKPSNPDFLLTPGELLALAQGSVGYRVLAFEDGYSEQPKPAMVQRICLRRESPDLIDPLSLGLDSSASLPILSAASGDPLQSLL